MRRHIRWALPGLSLVELLVTVFIATLVFAAMVPLFVGAQKKNVADNLRNIALQIAQDKIEKIRQLDFDQIVADPGDPSSVPNLYNPSFAGGQFGPPLLPSPARPVRRSTSTTPSAMCRRALWKGSTSARRSWSMCGGTRHPPR